MISIFIILAIVFCAISSYIFSHGKARILRSGNKLNPILLPGYFGTATAVWSFIAISLFFLFALLLDFSKLSILISLLALWILIVYFSYRVVSNKFNAKKHVEKLVRVGLLLVSLVSIVVTILIVSSILMESIKFFKIIPVHDFLFGTKWSPQIAIRKDQAGSSGAFGVLPVFVGTLMITFIAICIAAPLGLFSAIYLSEYASHKQRSIIKPLLETLAGIPTVVYGFFAAFVVAPTLVSFFKYFGISMQAESAFVAGSVIGIMIIPFVMSLSDDMLHAVPTSLRDGSITLGATKAETIIRVIIPTALPGIISAFILAISRTIGETMIVVMAAGLFAQMSFNPFDSTTTATVQIVNLLVGDQEFNNPKTLASFAISLVLFIMTFILNTIAIIIEKRYSARGRL